MELEFYIASGGTELIKRNEGRKEEKKKISKQFFQ